MFLIFTKLLKRCPLKTAIYILVDDISVQRRNLRVHNKEIFGVHISGVPNSRGLGIEGDYVFWLVPCRICMRIVLVLSRHKKDVRLVIYAGLSVLKLIIIIIIVGLIQL